MQGHPRHALFDTLISADHLELAVRRTARGKRRRRDVAAFLFDVEAHCLALREALADHTWRPARFKLLYLRDPKPRVIAKAPFADRVVHTALALLCEAPVLRSASEADFACRRGFGTHRAILGLHRLMCRHRFVVHLDVRSYFPSIRPELVRAQLAARVSDEKLLAVVDQVLASGRGLYDGPKARRFARMDSDWPPPERGLPMGAVTSQLFAAHLHLQSFDHFVKRRLRVSGYIRYVDDLFLFSDARSDLRKWRVAVGAYLAGELDLRLKRPDAPVLSCHGHLDALGMRVRRGLIGPLPRTWRRLRARIGEHVRPRTRRRGSKASLERSLASMLGQVFFG